MQDREARSLQFSLVYTCQYCDRELHDWIEEIQHLQIMHPEVLLSMYLRWEGNSTMETEHLPFGTGRYTVWGIPTTQRDDNRGLTSKQQDATTNELEIYRTDNEDEARQLVREAGFERNGVYYATTRISDSLAARNRDQIRQASGIHPRQQPLGKDKYR